MTGCAALSENLDGRKYMPKLKCPYGNHRFADVSDVKLRNVSELKKADEAPDADFIMECPKCRNPVALCIKTLHEPVGVCGATVLVFLANEKLV